MYAPTAFHITLSVHTDRPTVPRTQTHSMQNSTHPRVVTQTGPQSHTDPQHAEQYPPPGGTDGRVIKIFSDWVLETNTDNTTQMVAFFIIIYLPLMKEEVYVFAWARLSICLSVCMSVCVRDYSSTRAWIWMKCCVSTDVVTWTNWLTFEPDPDHSADAATGKSMICRSPSNRHLTQRRLQVTWCTAERYCLLHVVVQGPGSFANTVDFSVRRRPTVAELRGVNVAQFSDFGLFSP